MAGQKPTSSQGVLLFDEDDGEAATKDPQLEQKISEYLQERTSVKGKPQTDGEVHAGLKDDEADEEGEPDYDVASRMTLKASSEAFLEVMAEARKEYEKDKEAAKSRKQAKTGVKEGDTKKV